MDIREYVAKVGANEDTAEPRGGCHWIEKTGATRQPWRSALGQEMDAVGCGGLVVVVVLKSQLIVSEDTGAAASSASSGPSAVSARINLVPHLHPAHPFPDAIIYSHPPLCCRQRFTAALPYRDSQSSIGACGPGIYRVPRRGEVHLHRRWSRSIFSRNLSAEAMERRPSTCERGWPCAWAGYRSMDEVIWAGEIGILRDWRGVQTPSRSTKSFIRASSRPPPGSHAGAPIYQCMLSRLACSRSISAQPPPSDQRTALRAASARSKVAAGRSSIQQPLSATGGAQPCQHRYSISTSSIAHHVALIHLAAIRARGTGTRPPAEATPGRKHRHMRTAQRPAHDLAPPPPPRIRRPPTSPPAPRVAYTTPASTSSATHAYNMESDSRPSTRTPRPSAEASGSGFLRRTTTRRHWLHDGQPAHSLPSPTTPTPRLPTSATSARIVHSGPSTSSSASRSYDVESDSRPSTTTARPSAEPSGSDSYEGRQRRGAIAGLRISFAPEGALDGGLRMHVLSNGVDGWNLCMLLTQCDSETHSQQRRDDESFGVLQRTTTTTAKDRLAQLGIAFAAEDVFDAGYMRWAYGESAELGWDDILGGGRLTMTNDADQLRVTVIEWVRSYTRQRRSYAHQDAVNIYEVTLLAHTPVWKSFCVYANTRADNMGMRRPTAFIAANYVGDFFCSA
ncbi:hypothetical protein BJ912DRAFT_1080753 [Pholiota molesta]|nr:hypothetical protein BJ912DRAFT_1080753 [Pholiota molesta]